MVTVTGDANSKARLHPNLNTNLVCGRIDSGLGSWLANASLGCGRGGVIAIGSAIKLFVLASIRLFTARAISLAGLVSGSLLVA